MITALNVSNSFLERGFAEKIDITPMKLQKMLYFVYRDYLKETESGLFSDRFEVWQYGPVIPEVYEAFHKYKSNSIKEYWYEQINGKSRAIGVNFSNVPTLSRIFDNVWNKCKKLDGIYLSSLTHEDGSAWSVAYEAGRQYLLDEDIMHDNVVIG